MLSVITAIRAPRMQKDQLRARHTILPSHSGRQASERHPYCHRKFVAAVSYASIEGDDEEVSETQTG